MNKLQKLFESKVPFTIISHGEQGITWKLFNDSYRRKRGLHYFGGIGEALDFNKGIEDLWKAAKEYCPDAACFKEESNG